jgi:predicted lipid-binding transport protein (Tim44 family)
MRVGPMDILKQRFRWGGFGFIGGLVIGLLLGWFFHGVISTILQFGLVILLLLPFIAAFVVWRRLQDRGRREAPLGSVRTRQRLDEEWERGEAPIETSGTVVEVHRVGRVEE